MLIKNDYDPNYPYDIYDSWGGKLNLTLDDLRELQQEINDILNNKNDTSM